MFRALASCRLPAQCWPTTTPPSFAPTLPTALPCPLPPLPSTSQLPSPPSISPCPTPKVPIFPPRPNPPKRPGPSPPPRRRRGRSPILRLGTGRTRRTSLEGEHDQAPPSSPPGSPPLEPSRRPTSPAPSVPPAFPSLPSRPTSSAMPSPNTSSPPPPPSPPRLLPPRTRLRTRNRLRRSRGNSARRPRLPCPPLRREERPRGSTPGQEGLRSTREGGSRGTRWMGAAERRSRGRPGWRRLRVGRGRGRCRIRRGWRKNCRHFFAFESLFLVLVVFREREREQAPESASCVPTSFVTRRFFLFPSFASRPTFPIFLLSRPPPPHYTTPP